MAAERSRKAKVVPRSKWVRRTKQAFVLFLIVLIFAFGGGFAIYFPIYREAVDNARTIDSKLVVKSSDPSVMLSADGEVLFPDLPGQAQRCGRGYFAGLRS